VVVRAQPQDFAQGFPHRILGTASSDDLAVGWADREQLGDPARWPSPAGPSEAPADRSTVHLTQGLRPSLLEVRRSLAAKAQVRGRPVP